MSQTIGTWMLGKAQMEISAEEHQLASGPYKLTLTLPDASVVVSDISKDELIGLGSLSATVQQAADGHAPIERWDGQSGG